MDYHKNMFIVVDASLILKIILESDVVTTTKLFRRDKKFYTSPIFVLECSNTIKSNYPSIDLARVALENLLSMPITSVPLTNADYYSIMNMASKNKTSAYDCSYHRLAIENNGVFITCDKKYYHSSKQLEHIELWD